MRWTDIAVVDDQADAPMTSKLIDLRVPEAADGPIRLQAWQDLMASLFVTKSTGAACSSRDLLFRGYHLDRMLFFDHKACAHQAERTPSQIVTQGVDHIFIALQTSGTMRITGPDGDTAVGAGDFLILDLAQRAQLATEGMSAIQVCIPRRRIEHRSASVDVLHMKILPSDSSPLVKLMADHLLNMRACLRRVDTAQRSCLTSAALAICNAVLARGEDASRDHSAIAEIQIRRFIEDNLQRSELGVELLSASFCLSRTPLYKLFEADGGVASYIRTRRLALAMRMLAGVEGGGRQRVSSVAYACGYQSEKVFSRAFRRRYGLNPKDVNRAFAGPAVRENGALLASWLRDL